MTCTAPNCKAESGHLLKIEIVKINPQTERSETKAEFDVCHAHACEILSIAEAIAPRADD